jgi:hypothetical protein
MGMKSRGALAVALLGLGCGASYRFMYEGESAFEHCYALDFDAQVPPSERQACWRAWLANYTYGAGTERIEYARRHTQPSAEAPRPELRPPGSGAPTPEVPRAADRTNAGHAPPPLTEPVPEVVSALAAAGPVTPSTAMPSGATSVTAAEARVEPPGEACAQGCRGTWSQATSACAAASTACLAAADDSYRDCMRLCY